MEKIAMTLMTRRTFAVGTAALALVPATPAFAQSASRRFRFLRGTTPIGTSVVTVRRDAGGITATTDIDIKVKGLGIITLYRYALQATETYDAEGNLVSISGTCDDDGDAHFVNVSRAGEELAVSGSHGATTAPLVAGAASYWRRESLQRSPWISTQSGELLAVSVSPISSAEAPAGTTAYRATNGTDFTIDLFYDARGEWVGGAFDAKGDRAIMVLESETGALQV